MRMIAALMKQMELIERVDDWAAEFIKDMRDLKTRAPAQKLTINQFKKLQELHCRYCKG